MASTLISCNNNISSAIFEMTQAMQRNTLFQRVVGYTPSKAPMGTSSLLDTPGSKRMMSACGRHVMIPKGAIIDKVEFTGFNDFNAGRVEIGLGTFNNPINFPLIINTTSEIANEPIGGIRDFKFDELTGSNDHALVLQDSYINVCTTAPIAGDLQVVIYFHLRPSLPKITAS